MYAAGSEKEKRACGRLHGGTIAHLFVFYNGGGQGPRTPASARRWGRMVLSWPAPLSRPLRPPTFSRTGGLAVPPAGAAPHAPCWGYGGGVIFSPGASDPFLTFPRLRRPLSNSRCSLRLVRQHGKEVHGTASRAVQATHCASRCGGSPGTAPTQWFRRRNQPTWSSSASCRPSA